MKKKISLIFILLLVLVGCKKEDPNKTLVAFVSDGETTSQNSGSAEIVKGMSRLSESVDAYSIVSNPNKYSTHLQNLAKDYGLIITKGFMLNELVANLSYTNPEVQYLGIDTVIDSENSNVTSVNFKVNESAFLVGYIAALSTSTNQVGYVGLEPSLISDLYEYGFKAGVSHGAKELGKNIKIVTTRLDTVSDFEKGREAGKALYDSGIDIIYQTNGLTGMGVIQAAVDKNKLVIGNDIDQSYLAPNNVLISSIKEYASVTEAFINDYRIRPSELGGKRDLGLSQGAVGISPLGETSIINRDIYNKALRKRDEIISNKTFIPIDKESYEEFIK